MVAQLAKLDSLLSSDVGHGVWDLLRDDQGNRSRGTTGILCSRDGGEVTNVVKKVVPGSPASMSNIAVGDEILEVDGEAALDGMVADQIKGSGVVGSTCVLKIQREGRTMEVEVVRCSVTDVAQASEVMERAQQFRELLGQYLTPETKVKPEELYEVSLQLDAAAELMAATRYKQTTTLYNRIENLRRELHSASQEACEAKDSDSPLKSSPPPPENILAPTEMQQPIAEQAQARALPQEQTGRAADRAREIESAMAGRLAEEQELRARGEAHVRSLAQSMLEQAEQARVQLRDLILSDGVKTDDEDGRRIGQLEGEVEELRQLVHTVVTGEREGHAHAMERWQARVLQLQASLAESSHRMVSEIRSRDFELLRRSRQLAKKQHELAGKDHELSDLKERQQSPFALLSPRDAGAASPLVSPRKGAAPASQTGGFQAGGFQGFDVLADLDCAL
mmetsp:Transcript_46314/g.108695  ORF Transcript_46314/g.108695 Transcript_46314/m.108695 type:complete len:451 (-) Transcript_46314:554-1906(-)